MTNCNATALPKPAAARYRPIVGVVVRTAGSMLGFLVEAYRAQRDARHLMGLNDHLLRDVGISRGEIDAAVGRGEARRSV